MENTELLKLDLPRQKLMQNGTHALSDAELLALLIGTGTREQTVLSLAKSVLHLCKGNVYELGKLSFIDLMQVKGIGGAKAVSIIAALELGRRRTEALIPTKVQIRTSKDTYQFFEFLSEYPHEEFWILTLNRANRVIDKHQISVGGISGTVADTKIIFKKAIEQYATSIVLCHNHPSGNPHPSEADKQLTRKLKEVGNTMEIFVIDHLIIAEGTYYSFADNGMM